jgi:uncharacterized protein YwgA
MDRLKRDAVLIRLIEALRQQGSWYGETHIQKATYLLQELAGAQLGFDFILYKHGPFSFDLRDELTAMRADGLISLRVQTPGYGPSIILEPPADDLRRRFPNTLKKHEPMIEMVASKLGSRTVVELERLATSYYVSLNMPDGAPPARLAQRVHEIKPHIPVEQAVRAVETVLAWRSAAASFSE